MDCSVAMVTNDRVAPAVSWYGRVEQPRMVGSRDVNLPHALEGFKDEDQGNEDREALFSESGEEANDVARVCGHKDYQEQGDPHPNPEAKLEVGQGTGFGELEEDFLKHEHRSRPPEDDERLTGKDGKDKVAHTAGKHHLHWSLKQMGDGTTQTQDLDRQRGG